MVGAHAHNNVESNMETEGVRDLCVPICVCLRVGSLLASSDRESRS